MIEIQEVKTRKQIKEFIEFPLGLYKNCPYFVPPLYGDEKKLFKKDYVYSDTCEYVCFIAVENGKTVGRINAIIQKASNEIRNEKRVRFTRFDSIDDTRVSSALFLAAENWAKQRGMTEIVGPLGFSDLEREGLLIEGFDQISTFEEQYNYEYYARLIEDHGFKKEVDWVEHKIYAPDTPDDKLIRVSQMMLERQGLKIADCPTTKEFLARYADKFFDLLDRTYADIYGTVPFTPNMKKMMLENFGLILDKKNITLVVDKDDNVVCLGICFPSIGKALQKSGGRLTIPALLRLLKAIKHPKVIDLGLVGVDPEYAMKGVSSAVMAELMKNLCYGGIEYCETNLNLEDNTHIINQWRRFKAVLHKRRRSYVKNI